MQRYPSHCRIRSDGPRRVFRGMELYKLVIGYFGMQRAFEMATSDSVAIMNGYVGSAMHPSYTQHGKNNTFDNRLEVGVYNYPTHSK